jgi:predicted nucleotidyltransferase
MQIEKSPIEQLEKMLGVNWGNLRKARKHAITMKTQLEKQLKSFVPKDTSLVVFGSLARNEFTPESDIDWTLLVDGRANSKHLDSVFDIETNLSELVKKQPGPEGTFGGLAFSHDIIHKIGGGDDTNKNTTQRILLLLESAPIGNKEAYNRVIDAVLKRYIDEDWGWVNKKVSVPRFLLNDIVRYWRTLAVDFGFKRRQRQGRGWAIRTVKLRMSRKLIYASGLLTCYSCKMSETLNKELEGCTTNDQRNRLVVNHLASLMHQSPIDNFANFALNHSQLQSPVKLILDSYDKFIQLLEDAKTRHHLEKLSPQDADVDETYREARGISHSFQSGLDKIFLEDNGTQLFNLTKEYGVF